MLFNMCRNIERLSEDSGTRWLEDGEEEEEHKENKREEEEPSHGNMSSLLQPHVSRAALSTRVTEAMTKAEHLVARGHTRSL